MMGGPHNGGGGGKPQYPNECGGTFEFAVILKGEEDLYFFEFEEGQEVKVELVKGKLPKLEVTRLHDGMLIGIVPPGYSRLISCIESGWEYYGRIVRTEGSEIDPKISIQIKGER